MLLRLAVILALCSAAFAQGVGYASAPQCGQNKAFRSLCGNVGTTTPPTSPTTLTLGLTINSTGNYIIPSSGLGTGTETIATVHADNVAIFLSTFAIHGKIVCISGNGCPGLHIYGSPGAVWDCTIPFNNDANNACFVDISSSGGTGGNITFDHFTGTNLGGGADDARWLSFDWGTAPSAPFTFTLDHVDISLSNAAGLSRMVNLNFNLQANTNAVISNSKLTCGALTITCQGVQFFGLGNGYVYNTWGNMVQQPVLSLSGLTLAFDGTAKTVTRSAGSWITDGVVVGEDIKFGGTGISTGNGKSTGRHVLVVTASVLTMDDSILNSMTTQSGVTSGTAQTAGDTSRFIIWDKSSDGEAAYDDCDGNNNRCFRAREATANASIRIHDNWVWNINTSATGGMHFGDPDTGEDTAWQGVYVYNNNCELSGSSGVCIWARDLTNLFAYNNSATCNGCDATSIFGELRDPAGNGAPKGTHSVGWFWNNSGITGHGWTNENANGLGSASGTMTFNNCQTGAVTTNAPATSPAISPCP